MVHLRIMTTVSALLATHLSIGVAQAQPLGSFTWQLQPFCNRITVNVRQDGAVYTLDGFDDVCGADQRAPLVGVATPNPDGTIGFGLNIVMPDGQNGSVEARISLPALSGTWRDAGGNGGSFTLGGNAPGQVRPVVTPGSGDITGVLAGTGLTGGGASGEVTLAVNPAVIQSRVTTACPAGEALRSINQNGTALCEPIGAGGGDVTAVIAGAGLVGGGTTGDVSLAVAFSGPGAANAAARSDHTHAAAGVDSTAVGSAALPVGTGAQNTAVGAAALLSTTTGAANTALGWQALGSNTTGSNNLATGERAGLANTTGSRNTFLGAQATAGSGALTNAAAIGANAQVNVSNGLVLGSVNGVNGATASSFVGIGTNAPNAVLDVVHDGGAGFTSTFTRFGSGNGPAVTFRTARGTATAPTAVQSGDNLLFIRTLGHTGVGFTATQRAFLVAEASENWTETATGTRWKFSTTANGTVAEVDRLFIDHDGEIGIGTTNPQDRLQVLGDVRVGTTGTNGCVKNFGGSPLAGTCASDRRYKHDIAGFSPSLDRVAALRPVTYLWRQAEFPDQSFGPDRAYGLIAQEVEDVLPELVSSDARGYKAVDYSRLPLLAVQAIKELKEQNDALERRLAALEARLASLEPR